VLGTVGLTLSLPGAAQELLRVPRGDGGETALRVYSVAKDCALLAVISPGAGGTEDGYAYLANGLRDSGTRDSRGLGSGEPNHSMACLPGAIGWVSSTGPPTSISRASGSPQRRNG
jgi:hypothetical protein